MQKATSGEWFAVDGECVASGGGAVIAYVVNGIDDLGGKMCDAEKEANLQLLAAAPILLDALRRCASRLGNMDCGAELMAARLAIAKATGQLIAE